MLKIKCVTDVITNSSNETFIFKKGRVPEGETAQEFEWESIRKGWCTNLSRDEMIIVLVVGLNETLVENPFEKQSWDNACYKGWWEDELEELWRDFVDKNESAFKKLLDLVYVAGKEDNEYTEGDWDSYCKRLRSQALLSAGRDCDFVDTYGYITMNPEEIDP